MFVNPPPAAPQSIALAETALDAHDAAGAFTYADSGRDECRLWQLLYSLHAFADAKGLDFSTLVADVEGSYPC